MSKNYTSFPKFHESDMHDLQSLSRGSIHDGYCAGETPNSVVGNSKPYMYV